MKALYASLLVVASVAASPAFAQAVNFTIVNNTTIAFSGLKIRRSGTDQWSPLVVAPLPVASTGGKGAVQFSDPDCAFDLSATLPDGQQVVWQDVVRKKFRRDVSIAESEVDKALGGGGMTRYRPASAGTGQRLFLLRAFKPALYHFGAELLLPGLERALVAALGDHDLMGIGVAVAFRLARPARLLRPLGSLSSLLIRLRIKDQVDVAQGLSMLLHQLAELLLELQLLLQTLIPLQGIEFGLQLDDRFFGSPKLQDLGHLNSLVD